MSSLGAEDGKVDRGSESLNSSGLRSPESMDAIQKDATNAVRKYLESEVRLSTEGYRYLSELNLAASSSFEVMTEKAKSMIDAVDLLDEKYQKFVPYFKEIDELDESVKSLEAVVQQLDDYTRLMESKFEDSIRKQIQMRQNK